MTSPTIVQGSEYIDNPMRRLLVPPANQKVIVSSSSVSIYGATRSFGEHKSEFNAVEIKFDEASKLTDVTLFEDRQDSSVSLSLQFKYIPSMGFAPIHEIVMGRNTRILGSYGLVMMARYRSSTSAMFPLVRR